MAFAITETNHGRRSIAAGPFATFAAAVAHAHANFPIEFFEVDEDNTEAADFVTRFNSYAIEAA